MTVRIAVDLNVRVTRGEQAYSGFEDVRIPGAPGDAPLLLDDVSPGTAVLAVEEESGIVADATVTAVDKANALVYLAVDWGSFRDDPEAADDPACE